MWPFKRKKKVEQKEPNAAPLRIAFRRNARPPWGCAVSKKGLDYPPVLVPTTRPTASSEPMKFDVNYVGVSIDCLRLALIEFEKKVMNGEMTPESFWDVENNHFVLKSLVDEIEEEDAS